MRRVIFTLIFWLSMSAPNLTQLPSALASPAQQDCSGVAITSPRESGDPVRGRVNISGTASIPQFQFYKVEFAAGSNPADTSFRNMGGDVHRSAVQGGLLEVWDTTGLPDGPYTIRLTVVDIRGNFPCPPLIVRSIIIANRTLLATATPNVVPTVAVTGTIVPTLTFSATRAAAPTIALPTTAARGTVTATNTLTDTAPTRTLFNLDIVPDLIQAVIWGVGGMLVLGVIVGLYMAVRWVLDSI